MTRLIMVMGVQRSGTNALFHALSADSTVAAFNESEHGPWYDNMLLRPQAELDGLLRTQSGPVLLKPISETKRRSVCAVLEEFHAYPVQVAWIYRDPVNCFYSHIERWSGFRGDAEGFATHWCHRNRSILNAASKSPQKISIIRYENVLDDPQVFVDLQRVLGTKGRYRFRSDRAEGRRKLDPKIQECIDTLCASTLQELDQARSFRATDTTPFSRLMAHIRV